MSIEEECEGVRDELEMPSRFERAIPRHGIGLADRQVELEEWPAEGVGWLIGKEG